MGVANGRLFGQKYGFTGFLALIANVADPPMCLSSHVLKYSNLESGEMRFRQLKNLVTQKSRR
jgi:hypothetical protein